MGNRANVIFVAKQGDETIISPTVYLHWNGGPESVYAFLAELNRRGVRSDACYEAARFTQIVAEFMDLATSEPTFHTLSLGLMAPPTAITKEDLAKVPTDGGNNGFYIVDRTDPKKMVVRRFKEHWQEKPVFKNLGLFELTPLQVRSEYLKAMRHHYNTGKRREKGKTFKFPTIAEDFKKIGGKRKTEQERYGHSNR